MRGGIVAVVVSAAVIALAGLATARAAESYHQLKKYNFPAAEGSTREYFDYIMVDSAARRVYLSHGTEIKVIDADNGSVVGTIGGLKLTHGVAVADEFGRGFITDGEQGKVIIFDPKTLKVIGEAKADKDADSVVYDPASRRVFVMNGDPNSATVIDAKSGNVVFVNIEDKNELVAVDSNTLKIKSRWPVAPAGAPTALAMDTAHRRLFSAGRKPQMLVVLDADSGKAIQSFPITGGVDAAVFEPETGMVYVSTREGFVHIFHEDTPDKFSEVEQVKTELGAKTMGLDTKTHNIFVDTADFAPAGTNGRRQAIPGTFRVLVYGR